LIERRRTTARRPRGGSETAVTVRWRDLGGRARAWRIVHGSWSVAQLAALACIWSSAVTRRRGRWVGASVGFVTLEGAALAVGRGSCPMGPLQKTWGDPVPFFELLLSPRAARAAVPVLAIVTLGGIGGVVLRPPLVSAAGQRDAPRPRR
jgi:hypothetical protein